MSDNKLTANELQRVNDTLAQLQSMRGALEPMARRLTTLTPAAIDPQLLAQWYPQALEIVLKYLGQDHAVALTGVVTEPVMMPALDQSGDLMEAFKDVPAKRDWAQRYETKLGKIANLIRTWENDIERDPVEFVNAQKKLSLRNKTEFNFPARAILFAVLLTIALVTVMLPPVVAFARGFSNPHILSVALLVVGGLILAAVFHANKREFWLGCLFTGVYALLPFFCLPIQQGSAKPNDQTTPTPGKTTPRMLPPTLVPSKQIPGTPLPTPTPSKKTPSTSPPPTLVPSKGAPGKFTGDLNKGKPTKVNN